MIARTMSDGRKLKKRLATGTEPRVDLPPEPLRDITLTEFGCRLRQGALTIEEVTKAYLARIERIDPRLGAYEFIATAPALRQARALDQLLAAGTDLGPLMGVPVAIKDVFAVEGMPTAAGSRLDVAELVGTEGTFVQRLKRAGCVILGKTKTVEFAFGAAGINSVRGTPWNPWDPKIHRAPGGSSSGSAVAVAAGLCAFAIGTDTGGSIRLPASFCGVFGLKATAGLWPADGIFPLAPALDSIGLLTRSAADAALAFATLAERPLSEPASFRGRRLGRVTGYLEERLDPLVLRCYETAVDLFRQDGANVVAIEVPEAAEREAIFPTLLPVELLAVLGQERFAAGRDRMDPVVAARIERGLSIAAIEYVRCLRRHQQLKGIAAQRMKGFDAWIMPSTSLLPMPIAEFTDVKASAQLALNIARNSQPVNLFGQCATSTPIQPPGEALPVGLQLVCDAFEEAAVLGLALGLERLIGMPPAPDLSWLA
jgi:aspartyl-tRNA(Asn)/glutamyl-tRNA(Gln) amidotransferase subunit A